MGTTASLELEMTDARGAALDDVVVVELASTETSREYRNRERVRGAITLTGIETAPLEFYKLMVAPSRYRMRQCFVAMKQDRTVARRLMFPVNPRKVKGIKAPAYGNLSPALQRLLAASELRAYRSLRGEALYRALHPLEKACLLNLATKASATRLEDGSSSFEHMGGLVRLAQDRFFAEAHGALEEEASRSPLFRETSGALHEPPEGYHLTRSFKTLDDHGNLQLTFFRRGETGDEYVVDADIDEASGIEHVFEVIRDAIAGPTNPYDVREILIAAQGLDPAYSFVFG